MKNKTTFWIILIGLAVTGGTGWLYSLQGEKIQEKLTKPMIGEKIPDMGSAHVRPGAKHEEYNSNHPTSGPHWAGTAGPGIKTKQVPDELVLHSMEHGAAVVWYHASLPVEEVDKIRAAFNAASGKKIMLPRENLDVPVALTSWGYLLKLREVNESQIIAFIETNSDRAPEKAPI